MELPETLNAGSLKPAVCAVEILDAERRVCSILTRAVEYAMDGNVGTMSECFNVCRRILDDCETKLRPNNETRRDPTITMRDIITQAVSDELDRAYAKHGRDQWGRHEFYAILKEEVDELWDDIKADAPQDKLRREAVQVAAMVFRYLETGDRYREPESETVKDGMEE